MRLGVDFFKKMQTMLIMDLRKWQSIPHILLEKQNQIILHLVELIPWLANILGPTDVLMEKDLSWIPSCCSLVTHVAFCLWGSLFHWKPLFIVTYWCSGKKKTRKDGFPFLFITFAQRMHKQTFSRKVSDLSSREKEMLKNFNQSNREV